MLKWLRACVLVWLMAVPVSAQTIDHTSIGQFDQLTEAQIAGAASVRMAYIGRSVGWNIDNGLNCLTYASPALAPSSCRNGQTEVWTRAYNRSNWVSWGWPGLGLANPVTCTGNNGLWTGYQPCFFSWLIGRTEDVVSFQFDYLTGQWADSVANYFTVRSGIHDVFDWQQWAAGTPSQRSILWSTSLPRADYQNSLGRLAAFNVAARAYAAQHPEVLFIDLADIESHRPDGSECRDAQGLPIICETYTAETVGGHLNATGMVRVAKAVWVAMASLGTYVPPPPPPPPCPYVCVP